MVTSVTSGAAVSERTGVYNWYVLFVLFLGYVMNALDRAILNVLMPPIQSEFALSDTQLGLLGGIAFALFYSTLGIPIASLADRTSRKWVLVAAITLWSGMTAFCGYAKSFGMLLAGRVGTAVGEAGGSPPSHSLIADYFPLTRRGTALSLYALGVPLGGMLGLLLGGWGAEFWGWRTAFIVAGLPGVVVAALVALTIKEPPRGMSDGAARRLEQAPPIRAALRTLWTRTAFRHMSLAAALHAFVWYGAGAFNSVFLTRVHGLSIGETGSWMAAFALVGAGGTFLGGFLSDRLARAHDDPRYYMWIPGLASLLGVPFQILAYQAGSFPLAAAGFAVTSFLASFFFGPSFAMTQSLVSLRMRAVAASMLLFIQTMIGLGIGPLLAGALSDLLQPSLGRDAGLGWALTIVAVVNLWSALHYAFAARAVRADIAAALRGD